MNRTSAQSVLVSTTPDLEGWKITRYLGAVSAHVVAGTNIFSDIAASWSDVFGGQSKSYKKQLEQINEQAIDELREEASNRGGNALVGLRIDHDQISGQGKEMFMVSATATVVAAESASSESYSAEAADETGPVSARDLEVELKKETVVREQEEDGIYGVLVQNGNWQFVIENRIVGVATPIARKLAKGDFFRGVSSKVKRFKNRARDYFLTLPPEESKDRLYWLATRENHSVVEWAVDVIKDGRLLDIPRLHALLDSDRFLSQKRALEIIVAADKPYYIEKNIDALQDLQFMVDSNFEKRGEVLEIEKSGMLSSGKQTVWQIRDGAHNPMDREYCTGTGLNIYGFRKRETKPEEAMRLLDTKIAALRRQFDSPNEHSG